MSMLGIKVRDRVTGFVGIVTTIAYHLTGCRRAWVEGPANDKGETQERWIDESRLEVVDLTRVQIDDEALASAPSPSDCGHPRA